MKKTKRTKSTKSKFLALFSVIIVAIIAIAIISSFSSKGYTPDFTFTKSLPLYNNSPLLNANGIDSIKDEELTVLLDNAKHRILSCKEALDNKVENLNWEILDSMTAYYSTKFVDELGDENNVKAHYNSAKNAVEVNILAKGMTDLEETIIHEIFHGLIGRASINLYAGSSIIEALVEDLSKFVVGESYIMYYNDECQILYMMYNIWGEQETIKYIIDGEKILEKLDQLTKKGYGLKAMQGLDCYSSYKNYDIETAAYAFAISQEILVNATAKKAQNLESAEANEMIQKCAELMIKIEEDHYLKILGLS